MPKNEAATCSVKSRPVSQWSRRGRFVFFCVELCDSGFINKLQLHKIDPIIAQSVCSVYLF